MDRAPFFCRPRAGPPTKIAPDLSLRPLVRSSRRFPLEDHLPPFLDQGIKRRLQSRFGEGRKSYNLSSVRTHNGSVFRTSSFSPFARMGESKNLHIRKPSLFFLSPLLRRRKRAYRAFFFRPSPLPRRSAGFPPHQAKFTGAIFGESHSPPPPPPPPPPPQVVN